MLDSLWFMLFSNLEAFAWCALCMSMFRFKTSEYVWQILIVVTLMNMQSFILRNELSLAYLVPLINIVFVTLLFTTLVRVSLIGSLTIASVGLGAFALIQSIIALLLFGSIGAVGSSEVNGYLLQIITAATVFPLSWYIYRFGYGFSYDFEKFRLKHERLIVILTIIAFVAFVTIVLYLNEVWSVIFLLAVSLLFFLRYAVQKEREI